MITTGGRCNVKNVEKKKTHLRAGWQGCKQKQAQVSFVSPDVQEQTHTKKRLNNYFATEQYAQPYHASTVVQKS